ncbi:hypothetical protein CTI12_AA306470 [Artemisia annua]|uniref:DUF659 domain-containing protein n=1 Tax=Artemisia annua TaxID=35608 RepID=A0A2U1N569_ARTAN|nr:hypothetical protein CTI12_AA306470 [Artemisia annua]
MVFGKSKTRIDDATPSESQEFVDIIDDDSNDASEQLKEEKDNKPLFQEVTIIGTAKSKNAGGAKKADIKRCIALLQDREKYQTVFNKVKEAEYAGVSKSLKSSLLLKKPTCSKKPIEQSFGILERSMVDLKIMRGLCVNGIPFNVLRNPHFQEMVSAINKAPDGYKPPSSEKARTVLLDECVRDVEKDLTPIKDTWYSQGVSIVSDGWSNVKHNPLINVLIVNSRGAMFMYAEDFSGVEKTGVEIADFLISAIESVGPTNVLSVVTDNAANCKAAGVEIEKRDWVKHGNEHTRSLGQSVAETIRNDKFWDDVESILAITKPIFLLIKFCDGEGTKMGEIYKKMDNMLGEIKDIMADNPYSRYYPEVEKIVLNRWEKMTIPLHCLGFALSPRFYDAHYLSKLAPGGIKRKAPNDDKEVVRNVVEAFKRIAENDEENNLLRKQFATFHMKKGLFALPAAHVDAITMDAIEWWSTYGSETPELAEVEKKSYKQGPYKKWDINPESSNLESSLVCLDDMQWESLYEDEAEKIIDDDCLSSCPVPNTPASSSSPISSTHEDVISTPANNSTKPNTHEDVPPVIPTSDVPTNDSIPVRRSSRTATQPTWLKDFVTAKQRAGHATIIHGSWRPIIRIVTANSEEFWQQFELLGFLIITESKNKEKMEERVLKEQGTAHLKKELGDPYPIHLHPYGVHVAIEIYELIVWTYMTRQHKTRLKVSH